MCYVNLHVKFRVWSTKYDAIVNEKNEEKKLFLINRRNFQVSAFCRFVTTQNSLVWGFFHLLPRSSNFTQRIISLELLFVQCLSPFLFHPICTVNRWASVNEFRISFHFRDAFTRQK